MNTDHRYVVVGCGGLGSAALYWLARAAGSARAPSSASRPTTSATTAAPARTTAGSSATPSTEDAYAALAPAAYDDLARRRARRRASSSSSRPAAWSSRTSRPAAGADTGQPQHRRLRRGRGAPRRRPRAARRRGRHGPLAAVPALGRPSRRIYQRRLGHRRRRAAPTPRTSPWPAGTARTSREHSPVRALHPTRRRRRGRHRRRGATAPSRWSSPPTPGPTRSSPASAASCPLTVLQEQVTYYATPNLLALLPRALPGLHVARRRQLLRLPGLRRGRHEARPAHGRARGHRRHAHLRARPAAPQAPAGVPRRARPRLRRPRAVHEDLPLHDPARPALRHSTPLPEAPQRPRRGRAPGTPSSSPR